jgi:hypothetical protein
MSYKYRSTLLSHTNLVRNTYWKQFQKYLLTKYSSSPPPKRSFLTAYTPALSEHFKTGLSTKGEELTKILKNVICK